MNDAVLIAIATALLNGAVTWGVISTKLAWLRADLDRLMSRVRDLERVLSRQAQDNA